jgi:excinuclease ABC subunit A
MDGETLRIEDVIETTSWKDAEDLSLVIDRIRVGESSRARLAESIEQGYRVGGGIVRVDIEGGGVVGFGEVLGCADCEFFRKEELTPRMFSFNHQQGACPRCQGLGVRREVVSKRLLSHRDRGILDGAVSGRIAAFVHRSTGEVRALLKGLADAYPFDLETPYENLPPRVRHVLLHGWGSREVSVRRVKKRADGLKEYSYRAPWPGLIGLVERWYERSEGGTWARRLECLFERSTCRTCGGERLRPENLSVWVGKRSIADLNALTIRQAYDFFQRLRISATERQIAEKVLDEILSRLKFLVSVGLDYLTLDRPCGTLSGGEAQRIRLASQLGSRLVGVLYCLDEPTIGLHSRDTDQLMETLEEMRDRGNTVLVVEHDMEVIQRADYVVDIGPGAGRHGGQVVASGTPEAIEGKKRSLTGMYLRGDREVMAPATRREQSGELRLQGARKNNLKNLDVPFPRGVLTAVTGVSGSGKSTLVMDCLVPALRAQLDRSKGADSVRRLLGWEGISRAVVIDQKPIGRTPKSNAATYTGIFDPIRTLFASTPRSRMKGFKKGRFSFNLRPGRCGYCEGGGAIKVEMHFLPDVWLPCRECHGKRYNSETLSVRFLGKTIADVLEMEVGQALELFDSQPRIRKILQTLSDVGLEYLALGQPGNTLSGGEAQRVKLSRELATTGTGETLYVLDEPTTGLHLEDVRKLMEVLHRLVEEGHTVVVIEHHLDVIFSADHLIDLGPEGGDEGGKLVVSGTPEFVMGESRGHTGKALRARFKGL